MRGIKTIIKSILLPFSWKGIGVGFIPFLTGGLGWVFTSCSSDLESPEGEQGVPIHLTEYMTPYNEAPLTRTEPPAWLPEGYQVFSGDGSKAIGVFFTKDSPLTSEARRIYFNDDRWFISKPEVTPDSYYLYGYMPYNAANVTITPNPTYAEGATLTFPNLSSLMADDICVIVGAKEGSGVSTVTGLQTGKFTTTFKSGGTGNENYLFLLCEHLYAKLEFSFCVDNNAPYYYGSLRTIKLRKLELTGYTYTGGDLSVLDYLKKEGNVTVNLTANNTGDSPIADEGIYFTPNESADDMDLVLLFNGERTLPTDSYITETAYVPYFNIGDNKSVMFKLHSTYDVYDKKNNLIRQGCTADNVIIPQERFNTKQLKPGYKYTLQLKVTPTFLYVLSDDDMNNPGVEMD